MSKSRERILARKLRRQGFSIKSIAKKLVVSKSSASRWCSDIELTNKQVDKLINDSKNGRLKGSITAALNKRKERLDRVAKFGQIGISKIKVLSKRELMLIGTALYWAEGTKKNRRVVFGNSDPDMIKLFIVWTKEALKVPFDRLCCYVGINEAHKHRIDEVKSYWSELTGIPIIRFTKTSFKKVRNKKFYENINDHYGTLSIEIRRGTNLNYKILGMIDGLKKTAA